MSEKFRKMSFKFATIILLIALSVGVLNIPTTSAFYNDTESSSDNVFQAAMLDFRLTNNNLDEIIGPEALGEISHASVAMPESGSLAMQYTLNTLIATTTSNDDFCNGLVVEAKDNGITKYYGPLSGLSSATTTEFGTWEFRFDLPPDVSVPHGAQCNADATFSAWREDIVNPAESSWWDEETLNISFTARMVVLNEIYANPYAAATAPKNREYIELYNNGSTPVDVLGWKISEIANTTEKFYTVVASNATGSQMQPFNSGTIIPAGGFLVLVFGSEGATHFNNTGDTVKLYNNNDVLFDSYSYPNTAVGKSHVRYPDGIGYWVDPEPTPGETNEISQSDLQTAGLDDATISKILELANLRSAPMPKVDTLEPLPIALSLESTILVENATSTETASSTSSEQASTTLPVIENEIVVASTTSSSTSLVGQTGSIIDDSLATTTTATTTATTTTTLEISSTTPEIVPEIITETASSTSSEQASTTLPVIENELVSDSDTTIPIEPEPVTIPPALKEPVIKESDQISSPQTESVQIIEPLPVAEPQPSSEDSDTTEAVPDELVSETTESVIEVKVVEEAPVSESTPITPIDSTNSPQTE